MDKSLTLHLNLENISSFYLDNFNFKGIKKLRKSISSQLWTKNESKTNARMPQIFSHAIIFSGSHHIKKFVQSGQKERKYLRPKILYT